MKISICIGTCEMDRSGQPRLPLLRHCLQRIKEAGEHHKDYEVLVASDGDLRASRKIVEDAGHKFFACPRVNVYSGGTMRNAMMPSATGQLIWFFDDDDWPAPGALKLINEVATRAHKDTPEGKDWARMFVFKMRYRNGEELWREGVEAENLMAGRRSWRGCVGTPMVVFANRPQYLGRWGHKNYSDADMFESSIAKGWPNLPLWTPKVIANVRKQDDRAAW